MNPAAVVCGPDPGMWQDRGERPAGSGLEGRLLGKPLQCASKTPRQQARVRRPAGASVRPRRKGDPAEATATRPSGLPHWGRPSWSNDPASSPSRLEFCRSDGPPGGGIRRRTVVRCAVDLLQIDQVRRLGSARLLLVPASGLANLEHTLLSWRPWPRGNPAAGRWCFNGIHPADNPSQTLAAPERCPRASAVCRRWPRSQPRTLAAGLDTTTGLASSQLVNEPALTRDTNCLVAAVVPPLRWDPWCCFKRGQSKWQRLRWGQLLSLDARPAKLDPRLPLSLSSTLAPPTSGNPTTQVASSEPRCA